MYDINKIREDFPILSREVYKKPLVYLDNAATTQKPLCVLDAMRDEYLNVNANVHRGIHYLSQQATELHEGARETVRKFINARSTAEVVFTRGTTESLNLVASCFGEAFMTEGDEVIVSTVEHHSNIVPWQLLANRKGIKLRVIPMSDEGVLDLDAYEKMFEEGDDGSNGSSGSSGSRGSSGSSGSNGSRGSSGSRVKIVSVAHVSNVLGTVNPVRDIIRIAHEHGVPVMIDGAQSVPHFKVDVQELDCDFLAFSGHKVYGPTGIGVLYGKEEWLEKLPPYMGGGEMIANVSFEKTTFERPPLKFEAGTPDYVATTGLAKALDYVTAIGMDNIQAHEQQLTQYAISRLSEIEGMHIFGVPQNPQLSAQDINHDAVISFEVATPSGAGGLSTIHHMDMGTLLDRLGVAVRTGHHCAQPLMTRLGILGTCRASFALYNTREEIDILANGIERIRKMF